MAALHARGHETRGFQRHPSDLDTEEVLGDVRDGDAVRRAMRGCDVVVHVAAKVGVAGTREEFESVNVEGTRQVVGAAESLGLRGMVHVSTPSVAHEGAALCGVGAEPASLHALGAYSQTKAAAEMLALGARVPVVALRPHLVWGEGDVQLVGRILERARSGRLVLVNGGRALVDTTYVDNAADALVAAAEQIDEGAACHGEALMVSNGEPRPIRELVERFCEAAGVEPRWRSLPLWAALAAGSACDALHGFSPGWEPPVTRFLARQLGTAHWFDVSRTTEVLGWRPRVGLDEGLARMRRFAAAPES